MKERDLISAVMEYLIDRGHYYCMNNVYYSEFEADLLSVTGSNMLVEYEIKISRYDFFGDIGTKSSKIKNIINGNRLNRFYYVVPKNLISVKELYPFAGLIYVNEDNTIDIIKRAPLLKKEPIGIHIKKMILSKSLYRYTHTYIGRRKC